ncbi:MAG: phosphatase PAP2 family protein, partial [Lachnospiraceae bacterium]|nr:phosphatase PAP2 family protein [Lachnospiraceae bacterium]
MGNTFFFGWEIVLMETLQRVMPSWLMTVVSQLSVFGEEVALILILGLFYWGLDKKAGKYIGEIAIIGVLWNPMIKNVFCRRRPFMDNENIDLYRLIAPGADKYDVAAQGFSFPSGHSTNAASVYGGLARLKDSTAARVAAALIMLAVGFSRVAVGAHFP